MPNSNAKPHFLEVDDVFANYTILQFCGSGAYGEVYLAEDITHKTVALKLIPISSGSEVWRMELIGLRHYRQSIEDYSGLIEIMHVGETDNYFYYTMEAADNMLHGDESDGYVADTLAHRLERGGRLEPDKVLELANSLLDALEHLAEHDLAHRDIKPANIVFVNGQAKLSDIGLISTTGVRSKVVGTLDFLPPEIADGDPVGYGHDLFALGKVLYCALTGLLPENYPEVPLTVPLRAWRQFKNVILRACSPDPRQRFYTPADFRSALPAEVKPTTFIDEAYEHIRTYKKQHPITWRLSIISSILVLCALLLGLGLSYQLKIELKRMEREKINFIFRTIDTVNDQRLPLWRISWRSGSSSRLNRLEMIAELAANARAAGDMDATERYCRVADAMLKNWANDEYKFLLDKYPVQAIPADTKALFKLLEVYSNFHRNPLTNYLQENSLVHLNSTLASLQAHLSGRWKGPLPGSPWQISGDADLQFIYIASGAMGGEPVYSYWFGVNEVTNRTARRLLKQTKTDLPNDDLPVTGISWNDRLELCRKLTEEAAAQGTLPEGYIYRIPYADEWQFVLNGAGESAGNFIHEQQLINDYAWYGANSMYELHSVKTRQSGTPAVYDLLGNAAESVLTEPTPKNEAPKTANYGGSFRDRRINSHFYVQCEPDMLANKWSGMRLVLAPGNMDYFEDNWYKGKQYKIELNDKDVYEILGAPDCRWDGPSAFQWCKLLNCEPANLGDGDLRLDLQLESTRFLDLPLLVGAIGTSQGWQWLDKTPVYEGEWFNGERDPIDPQGSYLVLDHYYWRGIKVDETAPLLAIHYPKNQVRKIDLTQVSSPLILKKFSFNNRRYMVLRAPVDWYTAKHLANMLGAKLAEPADEKELQKFVQATADLKNHVLALGGYRQCGKWRWTSGKEFKLNTDYPNRAASLNNAFLAFTNGNMISSDRLDGFICEY